MRHELPPDLVGADNAPAPATGSGTLGEPLLGEAHFRRPFEGGGGALIDTCLRRCLAADPEQRYWLCAPPTARQRGCDAPLLVCVHGISRNARAHALAFAPWARRLGCVVVAPSFSTRRFPDYQRLGRPDRLGAGGRADIALLAVIAEVRSLLDLRPAPLYLFGHSGGAQFAQRFALVHADEVASYALSAAGSYAWPDETRAFPFGAARSPRFTDLVPNLRALVKLQGLVLVGDADDERSDSLRQGARVDAVQGATRLERAQRYVSALNAIAAAEDGPAVVRLQVLPGCGHAFSQAVASGHLTASVVAHFFGTSVT